MIQSLRAWLQPQVAWVKMANQLHMTGCSCAVGTPNNIWYYVNWPTSLLGKRGGSWRRKQFDLVHFIVSISQQKINVCSTAFRYQLFKSGFLHLTGQPYCKKSRSAKVKDGITNLILWNYLIDRYTMFKISHFQPQLSGTWKILII